MTRLRKMMLEELQRRNYSAITIRALSAGRDAVRRALRQVARQARPRRTSNLSGLSADASANCRLGTVVNQVAALRFFFVRTLKRPEFRDFLPYPRERELPSVLSEEEVTRADRCHRQPLQRHAC